MNTTETTCSICHRSYPAEVIAEPCPHCGAGFSRQIFNDQLETADMPFEANPAYAVYLLNSSEYWIGKNLGEILIAFTIKNKIPAGEVAARRLTPEEIDSFVFDDPENDRQLTFLARINELLKLRTKLPCFLASTEY